MVFRPTTLWQPCLSPRPQPPRLLHDFDPLSPLLSLSIPFTAAIAADAFSSAAAAIAAVIAAIVATLAAASSHYNTSHFLRNGFLIVMISYIALFPGCFDPKLSSRQMT